MTYNALCQIKSLIKARIGRSKPLKTCKEARYNQIAKTRTRPTKDIYQQWYDQNDEWHTAIDLGDGMTIAVEVDKEHT